MNITEISIPSTDTPAGLDDLKRLCQTGLAHYSDNQPTIGRTGYLDIWDETYEPGTFGDDSLGRRYLITRPLIGIKPDGGGIVEFLLCVFQRHSGACRILVSTTKMLSKTGGHRDSLWYDPIPSELSMKDFEAMASLSSKKAVAFPADPQYLVRLKNAWPMD